MTKQLGNKRVKNDILQASIHYLGGVYGICQAPPPDELFNATIYV